MRPLPSPLPARFPRGALVPELQNVDLDTERGVSTEGRFGERNLTKGGVV